jgi:PilZ domain
MDRRQHHRVRLRLPARLRWTAPFGQTTEIAETLDVSRSGLRLPCQDPHSPGVMLWVTFPYHESLGDGQPEIMARVVRLTNGLEGAQHTHRETSTRELHESALAVRFELALPSTPNGGDGQAAERRASERRPIALPVRVRWGKVPWFEEAMTVDVSAEGLRFLSNREYQYGDELLVSFDPAVSAPWPSATEHRATVVRVEPLPESPVLAVTVRRGA